MSIFLLILISTLLISFCSLIGLVTVSAIKKIEKIILPLISLSAGTLMGGAMLHLLPEAVENLGSLLPFQITLISFILFFLIEKTLRWHHCHEQDCPNHKTHTLGYLNLIGDTLHNFIDGLIIAAAFITNPSLGIATSIAIAMHEIPQEIGDFGVLLHSGFSKSKALSANFLVSITVVIGGVIGYFAAQSFANVIPYLLPFAAGGFLYISASDLIPEIRKESETAKAFFSLVMFGIGILLMHLLKRA